MPHHFSGPDPSSLGRFPTYRTFRDSALHPSTIFFQPNVSVVIVFDWVNSMPIGFSSPSLYITFVFEGKPHKWIKIIGYGFILAVYPSSQVSTNPDPTISI